MEKHLRNCAKDAAMRKGLFEGRIIIMQKQTKYAILMQVWNEITKEKKYDRSNRTN